MRQTSLSPSPEAIHPAVRVGHVHLRVADLDRAIAFYTEGLGFHVVADAREHGLDLVLVAAGDYHHHIALNSRQSAGGSAPPPGHTGLEHVAFLYPDRRELARAARRLRDRGYPLDHAADHGGTVAVYLTDPDGNGIELSYDRPRETWWDADGGPVLRNDRIDLDALIAEAAEGG
jgi:catechol 2,3-dioxygenase